MDSLAHYREGTCLVIGDGQRAERYISMAADLEAGMVVRVVHNFETYLVCEPAPAAERAAAERFSPPVTDHAGSEPGDGEKTTCE